MKKLIFVFLMFLSFTICNGQKIVEWVCTIKANVWKNIQKQTFSESTKKLDAEVLIKNEQQIIERFDTSSNTRCGVPLENPGQTDREKIMIKLFAPEISAIFPVCRMPVAANDFPVNGGFFMKNVSVENDRKTLSSFIKNAKTYNLFLNYGKRNKCVGMGTMTGKGLCIHGI